MAIFLVQHGVALAEDVDPERPLSEDGIKDVNRIAEVAKGYEIPVKSIRHSGKKRAEQTAMIFAKALMVSDIEGIGGMNPKDEVEPFGATLNNESNTMFVGHMPFLSRLTSHLVVGNSEIGVFKFQNSGIVCLDKNDQGSWIIKWTLMPDIS